MKILVTVGTGAFNELIYACDNLSALRCFDVTLQIGKSSYIPKKFKFFRFIPNLDYSDYDLVISHAGSGSVFRALELGAKLIVVPNLYRKDKHQYELAKYISQKSWCLVCDDLEQLGVYLYKIEEFSPSEYFYEPFFGQTIVLDKAFS